MECKHKTVSISVTVAAEELDKQQRLRGSVLRSLLEATGILQASYGMTLRERNLPPDSKGRKAMTPAERQQLKRDRRKAGLVRLELWVPADKEAEVREAVDEIITPPKVSDETLASIMRQSNKAAAAMSEAMAAWLEDQLPKETTPP